MDDPGAVRDRESRETCVVMNATRGHGSGPSTMLGCPSAAAECASRRKRSSCGPPPKCEEHLERDPSVELFVERLVHDPHAAASELAHNPVATPEERARGDHRQPAHVAI